jgi:TatD DNase family protein
VNKMATYIDAHCHLADPRFAGSLEDVLARSREAGIGAWVQGGVDPADWDRQLVIQKQHPGQIYTSFGLHPWWVARSSKAEFEQGLKLLAVRFKEADGLGELGLDYGPRLEASLETNMTLDRDEARAWQSEAFERQLELLKTTPKPLVLHIVRAHEDALDILQKYSKAGVFERGGLVHSFSGPREIAQKYLDLGFSLSISGGIVRKGFETLKRAVSYIPLDRLLVETDSPDQALPNQAQNDRQLNEPTALIEIARAIAGLRSKHGGESAERILEQSARNITRIFGGLK